MKQNEYKCAYCGNIYEKSWSDKEAETEAERNFGKHPNEWSDEKAIICDDCYTEMFPPMHPNEVRKAKPFL